MLRQVLASLTAFPKSFEDLCTDLRVVDETQHADFRAFVQHLLSTGVLQIGAIPQSSVITVQVERGRRIPRLVAQPADGWIDVYRRVESCLPTATILGLRERLHSVLRVLALIAPSVRATVRDGEGPRSLRFVDIIKASLAAGSAERSPESTSRHAPPEPPTNSAHRRLFEYLTAQRGETGMLSIPLEFIDEMDSGAPVLTWPVDCLVRVANSSAPFRVVVAEVWPAGTIDSRFTDGLERSGGAVSQVETYRAFVQKVEALTGFLFVEILAPPLSQTADNAVRRPSYTTAWTGDPNRDLYIVGSEFPDRYIPLQDIMVVGGPCKLQSHVRGQRIWPVYHATRTLSPPWDVICNTLLATAPVSLPFSYRQPDRIFIQGGGKRLPRILLGEDIVLCPGQWVLSEADLWNLRDGLAAKLRGVARTRRRLELPRWIYVSDPHGSKAVACDLESIISVRLIDQLIARHGAIRAVEMLPTPEQLLVHDDAHLESDRLSSELVIRLPRSDSLPDLAEQVALDISAAIGQAARRT